MSQSLSVQEYIALQPRLAWRRWLMRLLIRTVGYALVKVEVEGLENVPDSGPTILMMNHISAIDPVICMGAVTSRFVIPMTKAEVEHAGLLGFFARWWKPFFVHRGAADRRALMASMELIRSGQLVLIAPEGTRHPEGLQKPHDGLAYVATKTDAVIVPAAISYAQDAPQKLRHFRRAYASIRFGKPFKFKKVARQKRVPRETLHAMMEEAMYQLAMAVQDENARGVYSNLTQATTQYIEFVNPKNYAT